MISPFKCNGFRVTSPYGERVLGGVKNFHAGIDLVGIGSGEVCTVAAGRVVVSGVVTDKSNKTWEWGNYICVYGDDGRYYYYCHLASRGVAVGARVEKGQAIGKMGNTGYSFGAHLHLEVRESDGRTTVDPAGVLGIENAVGAYKANGLEYDLAVLARCGVVNTPDYWLANAKKLKYLPELIGNMARALEK